MALPDVALLEDMATINTQYLAIVRQLGQRDLNEAQLRTGVDPGTVARLLEAPGGVLHTVAKSNVLLFTPRFTAQWWRSVTEAALQQDTDRIDLLNAQALLLAASRLQEGRQC
ncbi:MAG: hypothetical protein U1F76_20850 [Candidatus Competibacteraceae bacterium]